MMMMSFFFCLSCSMLSSSYRVGISFRFSHFFSAPRCSCSVSWCQKEPGAMESVFSTSRYLYESCAFLSFSDYQCGQQKMKGGSNTVRNGVKTQCLRPNGYVCLLRRDTLALWLPSTWIEFRSRMRLVYLFY